MLKSRPDIKECEALLQALVRRDTSQPAGNEGPLADWILKRLQQSDSFRRLEYQFLEHGGKRKTLIVNIKGVQNGKRTAFVGHLDTVDCAENKDWKYPPLEAVVEDGVLYGRGAADMKSGVASMILTAEYLLKKAEPPVEPVLFCFTADEEKDGSGAKALARSSFMEEIRELIICEPSGGKIGYCEKGALWLTVKIHGVSSHASRPEIGVNAIEYAMKFEREFRRFAAGKTRHRELGENTMSVTRLQGGIMTNIIPDEALMEMDIRTVPGTSHASLISCAEELARTLEAECPSLGCRVSVMNNRPAVETKEGHPLIRDIQNAVRSCGMSGELRGLLFYTDASQLVPEKDIPFVIVGPGDDRMAHCVNEKVALSDVAEMTEAYIRFVEDKKEKDR